MGLFPSDGDVIPKPVIQIVLALAARETGVTKGVTFPEALHVVVSLIMAESFTASDVWICRAVDSRV